MKAMLIISVILGTLTASALEVPAIIDCTIAKQPLDIPAPFGETSENVIFTHEDVANDVAHKEIPEFENQKLSFDIKALSDENSQQKIHLILSERQSDGSVEVVSDNSVWSDLKLAQVIFRKHPDGNILLLVTCALR